MMTLSVRQGFGTSFVAGASTKAGGTGKIRDSRYMREPISAHSHLDRVKPLSNTSLQPNLSVHNYWPLFQAGWSGALEHHDPYVRWRTHRRAGAVFARVVRAFGGTKVANNIPTGRTAFDEPRTSAQFYLSPSVPRADLRDALVAALSRQVPLLPERERV